MRFRAASDWRRVETDTGRLLGSVRMDDFGGVRVVTALTPEEPWVPNSRQESRCFDACADTLEVPKDAQEWLFLRFVERRNKARGE